MAAGYSARSGILTPADRQLLLAQAQIELDPDAPLRRAIETFCEQIRAHPQNHAIGDQQGRALTDAIDSEN